MKNQQKPDLEPLYLFGIGLHRLTREQLLTWIIQNAYKGKSTVAYANIKTMNLAIEEQWYADFLNDADLVYCDGVGVILGARLAGLPLQTNHRATCPDWLDALAQACEQNGRSLFILAGSDETSNLAAQRLSRAYPNLRLGVHNGYFVKNGPESDAVIDLINEFVPDILCVGFGTPLQERWIRQNFAKINTHLFLPVGACIDYVTGQRARGPAWLTDHGFEWLCRLVVEPRRLWHRYIVGNPLFIWRVIRARLNGQLRKEPQAEPSQEDHV